MRPPIDGGVAVVTGASSGIGFELARELAPRVKALVLVARRKDRLEALASELKAKRPELTVHVHQADLGDRAQVDALPLAVESVVGPIDVLVNNAGLGDFAPFDRSSRDKLEKLIDVNVLALVRLTHLVLPGMIARGKGGILNVSSGMGFQWLPGFAVYGASKHFVTAFTESVRADVSGTGVVVTQVCPGPVATEFEENAASVPGMSVPSFLNMSAPRCARIAIRGFDRGRAIVLPGLMIKLGLWLGALAPGWLKRFIFARAARKVRAAATP